jgi:RNA polymerase sigma-70 factor (ECF subfamily)
MPDTNDTDDTDDTFAQFLCAKQQANDGSLCVEDLRTAFLCLQNPDLGATLIEHHMAPLGAQLARMGLAADQIDEVRQRLRCEVLLGTVTRPALIGAYQGRGGLTAFLRAVATRIGFRVLREHRAASANRWPAELTALGHAIAAAEPRKQAFADELNRGLRIALAALPARDRTLLRQSFVDGLSIDRLAVLHHVHRATAARWIQHARDALRTAVFAHVARALEVPSGELDSVVRWVQSQLEMSLHRLDPAGPAGTAERAER